jgi:hypothetical protein
MVLAGQIVLILIHDRIGRPLAGLSSLMHSSQHAEEQGCTWCAGGAAPRTPQALPLFPFTSLRLAFVDVLVCSLVSADRFLASVATLCPSASCPPKCRPWPTLLSYTSLARSVRARTASVRAPSITVPPLSLRGCDINDQPLV